jgi:hypothetical protein
MTNQAPTPAVPAIPVIPVICDRCRTEGFAGIDGFSEIRDLLNFEPVPRRAHADGWRPELQRAFIAALAITGSPRRAARAIGRAAFGAEQLRRARGGRSFAEAWDAALELYREREMMRLHENLAQLAREQEHKEGQWPAGGGGDDDDDDDYYDEETGLIGSREVREAKARIRGRLLRARRLLLRCLCDNPAKRIAWELLSGPVDWDKAARLEPQDNEPWVKLDMRRPDLLLTAEAGLLPDLIGGEDALAEMRREIERIEAEEQAAAKSDPPEGRGEA